MTNSALSVCFVVLVCVSFGANDLEGRYILQLPEDASLAQDTAFPRNPTAEEQIEMLQKETLDQGFYRLRNVNLFYLYHIDPGRIIMDLDAPRGVLSDEIEQHSVVRILSNRRVLKLYKELSEMNKGEAAATLNRHLNETFSQYRNAYDTDERIITLIEPSLEDKVGYGKISSRTSVISLITGTVDPNDITLCGLRHALLSLIWIAGALELEATHASIVKIAEEARQQRNGLSASEFFYSSDKEDALDHLSIYNRTILGTALLRTSPSKTVPQDFRLQLTTISQTTYDAQHTIYERCGQGDFSKGEIRVELFTGITDDTFDQLLALSKR